MHVSWESKNFPGRFIRHQNFLGELSQITSELDQKDASFSIPDGAGIGRMINIRSVNFPLHVLRHQGFRIKLHEFNPGLIPPPDLGVRPETPEEKLLREDSTFILEPGLADASAFSFRSVNFRDRFIRHRDFHLFVEPVTDELSRNDATFHIRGAFFVPPPVIVH
jgi:Alpha-L-arabinofuranosidase B (ABFB) domain